MRLQSLIFAFIICPAIVFAREWGIVIDCGSTGSRVKLYNWDENDPVSISLFVFFFVTIIYPITKSTFTYLFQRSNNVHFI